MFVHIYQRVARDLSRCYPRERLHRGPVPLSQKHDPQIAQGVDIGVIRQHPSLLTTSKCNTVKCMSPRMPSGWSSGFPTADVWPTSAPGGSTLMLRYPRLQPHTVRLMGWMGGLQSAHSSTEKLTCVNNYRLKSWKTLLAWNFQLGQMCIVVRLSYSQLNSVWKKWHEHIHEWVQNFVFSHSFQCCKYMICLCTLCFYPVFLFSALHTFPSVTN